MGRSALNVVPALNVTIDTNVLLRAAIRDDETQGEAAAQVLREAERVVITNQSLCEFVWVSRRVYSFSTREILTALEGLLSSPNVIFDRLAVQAGFATMKAGGDFADGIIAQDGRRLGGSTFVSFDKQAVRLLQEQGYEARFP